MAYYFNVMASKCPDWRKQHDGFVMDEAALVFVTYWLHVEFGLDLG